MVQKIPGLKPGQLLPQLPPHSKSRPHIFLDFQCDRKPLGRVVVEMFDDMIPVAVNSFISRCVGGSSQPVANSRVHRVLPGLAIFGGKCAAQDKVQILRETSLLHVDAGVLSIGVDGLSYCISLARALHLDEANQVVGKVHKGIEVVQKISSLPVKADDTPAKVVTVVKSGLTDEEGVKEFDASTLSVSDRNHVELSQQTRQGVRCVI